MSRYQLEKDLNDKTNQLLGQDIDKARTLFEESYKLFQHHDPLHWHEEEKRYTRLSDAQHAWINFKLGYLRALGYVV